MQDFIAREQQLAQVGAAIWASMLPSLGPFYCSALVWRSCVWPRPLHGSCEGGAEISRRALSVPLRRCAEAAAPGALALMLVARFWD